METIERFLKRYEKRSKKTVTAYRSHLKKYFTTMNSEPEIYFTKERNYKKDIEDFWDTIIDKPPYSRNAIISCVKMYFMRNGVDISELFWKDLKKSGRGKRAVSREKVPTNQELRRILTHGGTLERACFLMGSSSGMRIGELLQLTDDDVKLDENPVRIEISGEYTKSGDNRTTFITNEARDALIEWNRIKDNYFQSVRGKLNFKDSNGIKYKYNYDSNEKRIFPISYVTINRHWNKLITKAGFGEKGKKTGRYLMHIHCLRKYAKTRIKLAGVPEEITNWLVGHSSYLPEYDTPTDEELIPYYTKAIPNLVVFESQLDLTDVHEEQKYLREENQKLHNDVDKLRMKLLEVEMKQVQELQRNK